jgi:hypothetical protein
MGIQSHNYPITKAAYIDEKYPSVNYSGGDKLTFGTAVLDGNGNPYSKRIHLFADGLPDINGLVLYDVQVHYTLSDGTPTSAERIAFRDVDSAWVESEICYNNMPSSNTGMGGTTYLITGLAQFGAVKSYEYANLRANGFRIEQLYGGRLDFKIWSYLASNPANRPYITLVLSDSVPVVTPQSPLKRFVVPSEDTLFAWGYSNAVGGSQKSYILQVSSDGETWNELSSGTTNGTNVVVPANTLQTTDRYWRVKVVSQYDVESEWSAAVEIMIIAAPICSIGAVVETVRPEVSWTSDLQQAFQVKFGSIDSGTVYGTQKSYKSPVYLPDGEYTISVRTQSSIGLWSRWSEQTITVENTPGADIILSVYASHHARLSWAGGDGGVFYVLRDGVPIAKTEEASFTDDLAIGRHTYQVLEQLADDNYTLSNERTVILRAPCAMITPVSVVAWQSLKYSLEQSPTVGESHSGTAVLVHYVGRKYPVAETSEFEDSTLTFDVAFKTQDDEKAFQALIGQIVCYKNKLGRMIVGLLSGISVESDRWYSKCSCTISATDFQEEIEYE